MYLFKTVIYMPRIPAETIIFKYYSLLKNIIILILIDSNYYSCLSSKLIIINTLSS